MTPATKSPMARLSDADPALEHDVDRVLDRVAHRTLKNQDPTNAPAMARQPRAGRRWALGAIAAVALVGGGLLAGTRFDRRSSADAAILAKALIQYQQPRGTVTHIVQILRSSGIVIRIESWQSADDPAVSRVATWETGCAIPEQSFRAGTKSDIWDPFAHRIIRTSHAPVADSAGMYDPTVQWSRYLRDGKARVVRRTTLGKRSVVVLQGPRQDAASDPNDTGREELTIDARTGQPIAGSWGGGLYDGTGGHREYVTFTVYAHVPINQAPALSATAAFPAAPLVQSTPAIELTTYRSYHQACPRKLAG